MIKSVLIIDDEQAQAEGIAKAFHADKPEYFVHYAYDEVDIINKIENVFYNVAIVDLRMDKFKINGLDIIKKIIAENPFAKIIIVSAYLTEYSKEIRSLLPSGKIQAVLRKNEFNLFKEQIFEIADDIVYAFDTKMLLNSKALAQIYAQSKLENDTYKKGKLFEDFVILMFASMGYNHIYNRVIDQSRNETDIIIRNEVKDGFIQRFGEYILIECKNKPEGTVNKNDFILFNNKVKATNGLSRFGILITTGYITSTTYLEAMRESKSEIKIIFISTPEIEKILNSSNYLEEFKKIIDTQVKDN
jgi:CheY-like chemotaxis protein